MKTYLQTLKDTVSAECCEKHHYVYRDNLEVATNWIYGGITLEEYRLEIYNLTLSNNVTVCP